MIFRVVGGAASIGWSGDAGVVTPTALAVADFDRDAWTDVALLDGGNNQLAVQLNRAR